MTPDPDQCLHPADVEHSDGSIECDRCGRVIDPPEPVGDVRSKFEWARERIEAAKAREVDPDDRPAA